MTSISVVLAPRSFSVRPAIRPAGTNPALAARVGSDGAALLSIARFRPSWTTIIEEGALGRSAGTPPRVRDEASAGQVPVNAGRRDSLPLDDRAGQVERESTPDDREVHRRGWGRQSERRSSERKLRKRSVAFGRYARARGWLTEETAEALGLSFVPSGTRSTLRSNAGWSGSVRAACGRWTSLIRPTWSTASSLRF